MVLVCKRLKEKEEEKFTSISVTGMTFSFIGRSKDVRNKNVIRKMDEVSDYRACGNLLTEYVKTE
jgi:hypothetical protein